MPLGLFPDQPPRAPRYWCSPYCSETFPSMASRSRHRRGCDAFDRFFHELRDPALSRQAMREAAEIQRRLKVYAGS